MQDVAESRTVESGTEVIYFVFARRMFLCTAMIPKAKKASIMFKEPKRIYNISTHVEMLSKGQCTFHST